MGAEESPPEKNTVGELGGRTNSTPKPSEVRSYAPLEILYSGLTDTDAEVEVDIIAVHGLGSNVDWSWTWQDKTKSDAHDKPDKINWLKDGGMLPAVVPKARIMVYNYESKWHLDAPKISLESCGQELVRSVHNFRQRIEGRPIIFIGHSLGGNVIQHGLLFAESEPDFQYLPKLTVGLVTLGTPFRGTKQQPLPDLIARIMEPAGAHRGIIKKLDYDNDDLEDKLDYFCRLRNRLLIPIVCFYELYPTDYGRRGGLTGVLKGMMVEKTSASIPGLDRISLQTDHFKINKFSGPEDRSYLQVSAEIRKMCANAKDVVWHREHRNHILTYYQDAWTEKPDGRDCLRDLSLTDPFDKKNELKRKKGDRAQGTCEWILGTEELTAWLEAGQVSPESRAADIIWLYGNPGTGKSTMSIFLANELPKIFTTSSGKTLAYFFCDSSSGKPATATEILRGLLLQLVQQHPQLLDYVLPKYNEGKEKLLDSFDALWTTFTNVVADKDNKAPSRKYCIINTLDKCEEPQKTLLKQLEQTFRHGSSSSHISNLRILITSRPYPKIKEYLSQFTNKDLASFGESKRDIKLFIDEKVAYLKKKKSYTSRVKQEVTQLLKEKAGRIFLWVGMACMELESKDSKDAVKFLQGLPEGLHSLYETLLKTTFSKAGEVDVKRILSFVAVALQLLSLLELSTACQLHQDDNKEERIQFTREEITSCRLIVIIQDDKVLLLHQSVKDFLVRSRATHFNESEAHASLTHRYVDQLIRNFHSKD
ncbi:pfs domain-containing protein, partial [Thozetella sp. PMI_491]